MGLAKSDMTKKLGRKPDLCVKVNRHCNNGDLLMEIFESLPFKIKIREWNSKWLDIYCWDIIEPESEPEPSK